ncbi:MAG: ATP-grasp domain-containing protein, partial [Thermosynechococcaceae cyanobacterium]
MESRQFPADGRMTQVGVIGGGQLAQMMAEAAQGLGIGLVVQTPYATDPAVRDRSQFWDQDQTVILAPVDDAGATARLAQRCQVITFENEFVDVPALQRLEAQGVCFRPSLSVLAKLLDKYEQRQFLQNLNLPVPLFAALSPQADPTALGFEFPIVLKSRRHGYDGQGTFIVQTPDALQDFWQRFQGTSDLDSRFMVEEFVPFERELAIMAARSAKGEVALYPVVETYQKQAVCRWAIAPATIPPTTQNQIQTLAKGLLEALDAV